MVSVKLELGKGRGRPSPFAKLARLGPKLTSQPLSFRRLVKAAQMLTLYFKVRQVKNHRKPGSFFGPVIFGHHHVTKIGQEEGVASPG